MAPSPHLRELADGLFVWEHDVTDRYTSNVGVVVEDDSLTLIDAGARPASYLPLRDRLAALHRPVANIVLTHAHPDHVAGVVAFPGAEVITTTATAAALAGPLPVDFLRHLHPPVADDLDGLTNPRPTQVIDRPMILGRVDLAILGGHSEADIVATVVDGDVCFTGDLCFFDHTPLGIGADFVRWEVSLDWLPDVADYVPGHGPVGTGTDVDLVRHYLVAVAEAAREGTPLAPGPWSSWWHPWREDDPGAVDRLNIEQARDPEGIPPTLLELARRGAA